MQIVAERAIKVFPNVKKYFDSVKKNLPNIMTCNNLEEACSEILQYAKLSRNRYHLALEKRKMKQQENSKIRKNE